MNFCHLNIGVNYISIPCRLYIGVNELCHHHHLLPSKSYKRLESLMEPIFSEVASMTSSSPSFNLIKQWKKPYKAVKNLIKQCRKIRRSVLSESADLGSRQKQEYILTVIKMMWRCMEYQCASTRQWWQGKAESSQTWTDERLSWPNWSHTASSPTWWLWPSP